MKTRLALGVSLAVGMSLAGGCADESAPNRRGIERPLLTGAGGMENAEKRGNEVRKGDIPTAGKEFPGQSRGASVPDTVVYLDDVGTMAVTPASGPATVAAPATTPATEPTTVPTTMPATYPIVSGEEGLRQSLVPMSPPRLDDKKAYAVPGSAMFVPGTGGQVIPPTWGDPVVLQSYPHRPYQDRKITYPDGDASVNPIYYTGLSKRVYTPNPTPNQQGMSDLRDVAENPWFVAETIALPVMMVIHPPLAQRQAAWPVNDPMYRGKLPPTGEVHPAPYPGEIKFAYPETVAPGTIPGASAPESAPAPAK